MGHFQDTLMSFEDGGVNGYSAWNYEDEDGSPSSSTPITGPTPTDLHERCESPDLSVPSVMRWLTGQRHKPIGSEKLTIDVHFNHECMKVNLNHTICFPTASASRGSISFHLHIWALRPILETFLLAYCKGHSLTINNSKDICQIFYLTNGLCYIFLSS